MITGPRQRSALRLKTGRGVNRQDGKSGEKKKTNMFINGKYRLSCNGIEIRATSEFLSGTF